MKSINFVADEESVFVLHQPPVTSKTIIPNWFKKAPRFQNNSIKSNSVKDYAKSLSLDDQMQSTYKQCTPFTDAMTAGYMVTLSTTIFVIQEKNSSGDFTPRILWNTLKQPLDYQEATTMPHLPIPLGCSDSLFRWSNNWKIETPKGYSTLFMHPVARADLPFFTLTGFVDTDKHPNPVIFPFFVKKGFEGEIVKGTPIVQLIPVKRETWNSHKKMKENKYGVEFIKQEFLRGYKKLYWTKKEYY